jgi:hypothetical protein
MRQLAVPARLYSAAAFAHHREVAVALWVRRQVRGTVQRVQLDDQMLLAAHPVVLSPAGVGAREASAEAGSSLPMPLEGAASSASGASAGPQPLIRWFPGSPAAGHAC